MPFRDQTRRSAGRTALQPSCVLTDCARAAGSLR
jgi:hypothetical protein